MPGKTTSTVTPIRNNNLWQSSKRRNMTSLKKKLKGSPNSKCLAIGTSFHKDETLTRGNFMIVAPSKGPTVSKISNCLKWYKTENRTMIFRKSRDPNSVKWKTRMSLILNEEEDHPARILKSLPKVYFYNNI